MMKQVINGAQRCNRNSFPLTKGWYAHLRQTSYFGLFILLSGIMFTSCMKKDAQALENQSLETKASVSSTNEGNVVFDYTGLSQQTVWELQQARSASSRYRKLENALKDGYVNIDVIVPHMGYHYLKPSLVDSTFDPRSPEILVYNKDDNGDLQLVAVEYAQPLSGPRPEGFTGSSDVWDGNAGFQLWLLHAWVWAYNPDGVFNPTNPLVDVH